MRQMPPPPAPVPYKCNGRSIRGEWRGFEEGETATAPLTGSANSACRKIMMLSSGVCANTAMGERVKYNAYTVQHRIECGREGKENIYAVIFPQAFLPQVLPLFQILPHGIPGYARARA